MKAADIECADCTWLVDQEMVAAEMAARFDFSAHAVPVTGGSSGIGRAAAGAFRDAGANVVIIAPERYRTLSLPA